MIKSLLEAEHLASNPITLSSLEYELGKNNTLIWIGFFNYDIMAETCGGTVPFHLYYSAYRAQVAQNLGASAALTDAPNTDTEFEPYTMPPQVHTADGTVKGTTMRIPAFQLKEPVGGVGGPDTRPWI